MTSIKKLNKIRFSLIPLLTLINITSSYQPVIAQSSHKIQRQFNQKQESGSDRGRPTKRKGMASRNDCPSTNIPLTALIPENKVSKVVEASPTFWIFIPYESSKIPLGEFVLQDEANNDVYRTDFTINKGEGIASITIEEGKTLETNKIYQWYFKLYCDRSRLSQPIFVRGWVQRVVFPLSQQKQLNTVSSQLERVAFYSQNGIWYSALTELAQLRQAYPQNQIITKDWLQLLNAVGLQELSNKPIVGSIN